MDSSIKTRTARHRRGTAVVETALMLPILIIVTFGAIDISQYVSTGQVINNASREAARVASRVETQSVSDVEAAVLDYLVDAMPHLTRKEANDAVTVQVRVVTGTASPSTAQAFFSTSLDSMVANLHRPLLLAGNSLSVCYPATAYGSDNNGNRHGRNGRHDDDDNEDEEEDDGTQGGGPNRGNTYAAIPSGDLSSIESGSAISVQLVFDFEAIRWLSGPTYAAHSTETVCRRE